MARKAWFNGTTPKGRAKYPHLATPDTKFNADGEYHIKLLMPVNSPEEQTLIRTLDELTEKAVAEMKEQNKKFAKVMTTHTPYKPELDKDGNETGNTEFNFKMKAKVTVKNGPKAGTSFTQSPRLFDAAGVPVKGKLNVGGGSIVKVNYDAAPFFSAKDKLAGVTLRLIAVQVIELKQWEEKKGTDFGFEKEDGYSATESGDAFPDETSEGSDSEGGDDSAGDDSDASEF